jgi:hypothetical protein
MVKLINTKHRMVDRTDGVADIAAQLSRTQAADPRDKICSFLGLSKPDAAAMIHPDYKRGTVETFARTTYDLISKTGSFSVMAYVSQERPRPRGLPTWTVDFSFGGLDESARARLYKRELFSESGSTCNFYDNNDSDDELEKILTRTRKEPASQPRVGLSQDEKCMTARGFIIDTVNDIVFLPRSKPGNIDENFVSSLVTVLDGLLGHRFAS